MSEPSWDILQDSDLGLAFRIVSCKKPRCQSNDNNHNPISSDTHKEKLSFVLRVSLGQFIQYPADEIQPK